MSHGAPGLATFTHVVSVMLAGTAWILRKIWMYTTFAGSPGVFGGVGTLVTPTGI
jgi:hypothetical protein